MPNFRGRGLSGPYKIDGTGDDNVGVRYYCGSLAGFAALICCTKWLEYERKQYQ